MLSLTAALAALLLPTSPPTSASVDAPKNFGSSGFIENKGQWDDRARFMAQGTSQRMWVTDSGLTMEFEKEGKGHAVRISVDGGGEGRTVGRTLLPGVNHYLDGDKSQWVRGARSFRETYVQGMAPGVDARFYFDKGAPRYDLVVKPGVDASKLKVRYEGADDLRADAAGALSYRTSLGRVYEQGLFAFQKIDGRTKQVAAKAKVNPDGTVSYRLGGYDRTKTLVIDPILRWSTYLGGSSSETMRASCLDGNGNVLFGGSTRSDNFPTTVGSLGAASGQRGVVVSYTADGVRNWSVVLGTSLDIRAITYSAVGPLAVGAGFDSIAALPTADGFNANKSLGQDAFYLALSPSGDQALASSWIGGTGSDQAYCVDLDPTNANRAYIGGVSSSTDFPVTAGAFRTTRIASQDGFIFELDLSKVGAAQRSAASYFGGAGSTICYGITFDSRGGIWIGGETASGSTSLPLNDSATGPVIINGRSGGIDGFVTYMDGITSQSAAKSTQFFGTSGTDRAVSLAFQNGKVLVGGMVSSGTTSPPATGFITSGSYSRDGFLFAFDSTDPLGVLYATRFGGGTDSQITAVAFDEAGMPVVTGYTNGNMAGLPAANAGATDGFLYRLNVDASAVLDGRFLGGTGQDQVTGICLDGTRAYFVGVSAGNFSPLLNADQATFGGFSDAVLGCLDFKPVATLSAPASSVVGVPGRMVTFTATLEGRQPSATTVTLSSSNPAVTVPASVTVPAGDGSATFDATVTDVFSSTPVTITATVSGVANTFVLTVNPPTVTSLVLDQTSVAGSSYVTGILTIDLSQVSFTEDIVVRRAVVQEGTNTSVRSLGWADVVSSNKVPRGSDTMPIRIYVGPTTTERRMQLLVAGGVRSATFSVLPTTLQALNVGPNPLVGGRALFVKAVLSSRAPVGGTVVSLTSSDPSVPLPATITVPQGAFSVRVQVTTLPVAEDKAVAMSASISGQSPINEVVVVRAPTLVRVTTNSATVAPGGRIYGVGTLSGPAPVGGISYSVSVPELSGVRFYRESGVFAKNVTVPAGATYGPSPKWILQVPPTIASGTVIPITATLNGVTRTVNVTVQ